MHDTIAAIATAHGVGSIAIVRLSGEHSLNIALKLSKKQTLQPRYAALTSLHHENGTLIDEAIVNVPFSWCNEVKAVYLG